MSIPSEITFDLAGGESGKAQAEDSAEKAEDSAEKASNNVTIQKKNGNSYTLFPVSQSHSVELLTVPSHFICGVYVV